MPDFFEPDGPFPIDKFPPTTDEDKKALQDFFGGTANPSEATSKLKALGENLKSSGVKRVGVYGFCWGVTSTSKIIMIRSTHHDPRWQGHSVCRRRRNSL